MKTEVIIPKPSVTEKPLTGPDPIANKITAVINVVIFASIIAESAFSYPNSIALAGPLFNLISSLMRSKIKTFASTAIPIVNTIPAIPGSVNVAPMALNNQKLKIHLR